jgi:para-aminobenzoate synthetase / 4-amino-4-deoxychorismate lyase
MSDIDRLQLVRQPLGWQLSAADVLRLVRADAHPVALCGQWMGGSDIVAAEPIAVRTAPGPLGDVFDSPFPVGAGGLEGAVAGFAGGWIGYLGYSAAGEALPPAGARALPGWWFGFYDHVLRRDRASGAWFFEALWTEQRGAALTARIAQLERRAAEVARAGAAGTGERFAFAPFRLTPGAAGHEAAVARTVQYIKAGDVFQANITLRAEAEFDGDPLDAFCRGLTALGPPYAAFIGVSPPARNSPAGPKHPAGRAAVASLSPELFLRRSGSEVTSRPIKGTAPRTATGPGDVRQASAQRAGLVESAKNRAENVMIVDLVRNDLSRVCVPGSVTVPALLVPEPHPAVWHLVSTVTGTLEPEAGDGDLIRAAFPPGSVTGAPKVRALEIIDELEAAPREAYTGAIGYRSPVAGLELNVAIRTFEFAPARPGVPGRAWLGAGGGIVADSDPAAEYAECLLKASPLVAALGARLDTDVEGPGPDLRPRPSAGVFTSLLVTAGQTRGLDAHLARLAASVRELYARGLPPALDEELAACLADRPTGRLRITVRPVGGPLQATVEVVPVAVPPPAVTLRPVTVPGGIGGHKYRDRRLLSGLTNWLGVGSAEQLLIVDETGELLETDRANLFAVIDGVLLTPPADGRLLPGTARAATRMAARELGILTGQKPLTYGELAAATEIFVTNAVAGILPVGAIEGWAPRWTPGPTTTALAAALATSPYDPPATQPHGTHPYPPPRAPQAPQARQFRAAQTQPPSRPGSSWHTSDAARAIRPSPLIVLIDNYDSFTWNLAHLLVTSGARVEVVRNDEVTAAEVVSAAPAGVVISPGPGAPADAGISMDTVTACAQAGIPLLGICLGHEAIGAAFGARIVSAPRPVHGRASVISHDGRGVLAGLPEPFQAARYHSLIVDEFTLPLELAITARTATIPMGIRHRTIPVEGIQFHPESILTSHGAAIIKNFTTAARAPR